MFKEKPEAKVITLKDEASIVVKQIATQDAVPRVVDGNEVNISKLNELKNINYEELKRRLRTEGDFCIYFEDDKGYIVLIDNTYKGIGASTIDIKGTPCSQK